MYFTVSLRVQAVFKEAEVEVRFLIINMSDDGGLNNGIGHNTGKKNSVDFKGGFVRVIEKKCG